MSNQLKIVALLAVFTAVPLNGGQRPPIELLKLTAKEGRPSFAVPLEIALQSPYITKFIDIMLMAGWKPEDGLPTKLSAPLLFRFAAALRSFYMHKDLKGKALFDAVFKDLEAKAPRVPADASQMLAQSLQIPSTPALSSLHASLPFGLRLALFKVADQYEFEPLYQLMARELMHFMLAVPDIFKIVKQRMPAGGKWKQELARWYYLLTGKNLQGIDDESYGFSIRELRDYKKPFAKLAFNSPYDFSFRRIDSLDGFDDLPNIKNIQIVYLEHNHLVLVPKGIFNKFVTIDRIDLGSNRIIELEADCFPPDLRVLNLMDNRISVLNKGIVPNKVRSIVLSNNGIEFIEPGILPESLIYLTFANNRLKDVSFLASLPNLKFLDLAGNKIEYLDPAHLPRTLKMIYLQENHLSKENKKAIRNALPNAEIYF